MFIVLPRLRLRISVFAIPAMLLMLWCEGAEAFIILMLSAAVHEAGHIWAMYFLGYRFRRMDILPMGALIICPEGIPYIDEYKIALSGPLASLLLAFTGAVWFSYAHSLPSFFLALINLVLALFNLMPIKKLDGGKAIYCFLTAKHPEKQDKTEQICSVLSIISKTFFLMLAAVFIIITHCNLGVIILSAVLLIQLLGKS